MQDEYVHESVLVDEVVSQLHPQKNELYIDATIGGGGHAEALLKHTGPKGIVIGCDLDPRAVYASQHRLHSYGARAQVIRSSYTDLRTVLKHFNVQLPVSGIVADLGLSSDQLKSGRGFSFLDTNAIDMRFDPTQEMNANIFLMKASESELETVLREFGDVERSKSIARAIVRSRSEDKPFTGESLAALIAPLVQNGRKKINPATLVFQAIRIVVNRELQNIKDFLPRAIQLLAPGGRIAIISFHSIEDRIVKEFFRKESKDCICPPSIPICVCEHVARIKILTKKPLQPSKEEISRNPRSRSARLRAAEKIA